MIVELSWKIVRRGAYNYETFRYAQPKPMQAAELCRFAADRTAADPLERNDFRRFVLHGPPLGVPDAALCKFNMQQCSNLMPADI